jgi:uncharacterized protein DUF6600
MRALTRDAATFQQGLRGALAEMSRLRRWDAGTMLVRMIPPNKRWALFAVLTLGLWAGGAAAQSGDESGWFDEQGSEERPQLKIQGRGQYDPPPPDFRSEPPNASREGPAVDEDEPAYEEDTEDAESQQRATSEFAPELSPYGRWVDDPYYGRVWVPSRGVVGSDFRPYVSGGHWELTPNDEWLWASDYPFGWVTFHYGRWAWMSTGAWGWVPGYTYAPAWVNFRVGANGYVGWGPAPPYSVWRGGAYISLGYSRPVPYIFCPTTYVFSSSLPRYVVRDRYRVRSIAAQSYRYQPRYISGSVRTRSPSPREARIPSRYVPARRVVAEPRARYAATDYRRRVYEKSGPTTSRGSSPVRESRARTSSGGNRDPRWASPQRRDRSVDVSRGQRSPRGQQPSVYDRGRRGQANDPRINPRSRDPRANEPRGGGPGEPRWRNGGRDNRRDSGPATGSSSWAERRPTAPRAREDAGRGRWASPPAGAQAPGGQARRGAAAAPSDRRGDSRRGGPAPARSPSQQRSRNRDNR